MGWIFKFQHGIWVWVHLEHWIKVTKSVCAMHVWRNGCCWSWFNQVVTEHCHSQLSVEWLDGACILPYLSISCFVFHLIRRLSNCECITLQKLRENLREMGMLNKDHSPEKQHLALRRLIGCLRERQRVRQLIFKFFLFLCIILIAKGVSGFREVLR